eukprot:5014072-Pyramimonas_sp.AAC.1
MSMLALSWQRVYVSDEHARAARLRIQRIYMFSQLYISASFLSKRIMNWRCVASTVAEFVRFCRPRQDGAT